MKKSLSLLLLVMLISGQILPAERTKTFFEKYATGRNLALLAVAAGTGYGVYALVRYLTKPVVTNQQLLTQAEELEATIRADYGDLLGLEPEQIKQALQRKMANSGPVKLMPLDQSNFYFLESRIKDRSFTPRANDIQTPLLQGKREVLASLLAQVKIITNIAVQLDLCNQAQTLCREIEREYAPFSQACKSDSESLLVKCAREKTGHRVLVPVYSAVEKIAEEKKGIEQRVLALQKYLPYTVCKPEIDQAVVDLEKNAQELEQIALSITLTQTYASEKITYHLLEEERQQHQQKMSQLHNTIHSLNNEISSLSAKLSQAQAFNYAGIYYPNYFKGR